MAAAKGEKDEVPDVNVLNSNVIRRKRPRRIHIDIREAEGILLSV